MKHLLRLLSNHLLVSITLAFIAGLSLSPHLQLPQNSKLLFTVLLACFFLIVVLVSWILRSRSQIILVLLLPLSFCTGTNHGFSHLSSPSHPQHIYNLVPQKTETVVMGNMIEMASYNGKISRTTLSVTAIRFKGDSSFNPAHGKIVIKIAGPWPKTIAPGDSVLVRCDLKRPKSYKTAGAFDYARFLARKDIWVSGFIRSPLFLAKTVSSPSVVHQLRYGPERMRTKIGSHLDASLPPHISSIYRALLIGDRSRIDPIVLETFKGSGTLHILAISGLHVTILTVLLYTLFYWILSRFEKLLLLYNVRKIAVLLCLPFLLGYSCLAGLNLPVLRAIVMAVIVIFAICINHRKSPSNVLAAAALILLMFNPLQLFTVSFQLSFAAVSAILLILPIFQKLLFPQKADNENNYYLITSRYLLAAILVSVVASLATLPISLIAFNRFSTVGPLTNLILEPTFCLWSLPAGIIAIALLFISPEISTFILHSGALGIKIGIKVASFFSSLPFATVYSHAPSALIVFFYYSILVVLCLSHNVVNQKERPKFLQSTNLRVNLVLSTAVVVLLISLVLFSVRLPNREKDLFQVSFIDVGQGSVTLLRFPNGHTVLIDCGGSSFGGTNVGRQIVGPYLWQSGIQKIDEVIITHPDADHYNGIPFVLNHFVPKKIWVRDTEGHDENYRQLLEHARRNQVKIAVADSNQILWGNQNSKITCLANMHSLQAGKDQSNRNKGLVVKACSKEFCILFPGDIHKTEEMLLVEKKTDLSSDILLAAHHGSRTSGADNFLQAVSPELVIVSSARPKAFINKSVLASPRPRKNEKQLLLFTARNGTIEVEASEKSSTVFEMKRLNDNPLYPFKRSPITIIDTTPQ